MNFTLENSRDKTYTAAEHMRKAFPEKFTGECDAEFVNAKKSCAVGVAGLPYYMPLCLYILNDPQVSEYLCGYSEENNLFCVDGGIKHYTDSGEKVLPEKVRDAVASALGVLNKSAGYIDGEGAHVIDLKTHPVGSHFDVNLLLGNRVGFENPLLTTPKAALDSFGRGSFRAAAETTVLANRYVLRMEENGEPVNRQFYIYENGKQIFYSANANENVKTAVCRHLQNRTVITYETECGLKIKRTIFIMPQEEGMPEAVEAQRVEIENTGLSERNLKIVFTGMFGIFDQQGVAGDIVYVNIVHESGIVLDGDSVAALSPHFNPRYGQRARRFATLFVNGEYMDEYSCDYNDFVGGGDILHPQHGAHLSSHQSRKSAPFFAMAKNITLGAGETVFADSYAGIVSDPENADEKFKKQLAVFTEKYKSGKALTDTYAAVVDFVNGYSSYIDFRSDDSMLNSYISRNLPFQVLYQSFVTRAFAWTQKGGRMVGFREIQDMYASMYYMTAMGNSALAKDMIKQWACNVYEEGYANHNFYWESSGAGGASDDQLWLVQAVYRYVMLTGDISFLDCEYPIAGSDKKRSLFDTMLAAVTYSGCISLGKHGLPLLDGCDWNDCLCLDTDAVNGPTKIKMYREQLERTGGEWGEPIENHWCESVMNAFLLKLAYDQLCELCKISGRNDWEKVLSDRCKTLTDNIQKHAWKGDFFARCLINNPQMKYEYLGGMGDGMSANPDFPGSYWLNSFSWSVLSGCADEEQIRVMLDSIEKYIKTPSGLTLTSPCAMERISRTTAQDHYFKGDRENGAVFKHATMMATAAMFKAAKTVKDEKLAERLSQTGFWMVDLVVPYSTLKTPFITKGNPRFCTQYNNSETRENIGPMLSGTASWLALTTFEYLGVSHVDGGINLMPILPFELEKAEYTVRADGASYDITVTKNNGFARPGENTKYTFDGMPCGSLIPNPKDGKRHKVTVSM
ncbi:MAG: glycosyl transferase [Clostridia bacterium]|nr:glycosyl transferase [Clostridia bacterium]